jgi:hypothetical protein
MLAFETGFGKDGDMIGVTCRALHVEQTIISHLFMLTRKKGR